MSEDQILEYLKGTSKENPKHTLEISKAVFGNGATKRIINPTLYKLQKKGQIEKIANENGGNPRWYIIE